MKVSELYNFKFLSALLSIAITFIIAIGHVDSAPYQELEPRKGYVPVYIRYGETPLSEIHPKLAEAFREDKIIHVDKIKSADIIESEHKPTDEKTQKDAENRAASKPVELDSDIASFDAIKGKDNNDDKE